MRELFRLLRAVLLVAPALAVAHFTLPVGQSDRLQAMPAAAGVVSGHARVVDGDTVDIGDIRIRLEGIDAPEAGQRCPGRFIGTWRCGRSATRALEDMIGTAPLTCEGRGKDRHGRMIGVCFAQGKDVNAEMVRAGLAWAFVKYSDTYTAEEAAARSARAGIWATDTPAQTPWDYRARRWSSAETQAPGGCAIKGNISQSGDRIYHTPWSPWYDRVRVNEQAGERWFCSEGEATKAGWRSASGS